jgi:hypothetical protein
MARFGHGGVHGWSLQADQRRTSTSGGSNRPIARQRKLLNRQRIRLLRQSTGDHGGGSGNLPAILRRRAPLRTRRANHLDNFSTPLSSPIRKNILISRKRKSPYIRKPSRSSEGRCATSRNAERDAVDAGGAHDGRCGWRTAKACGPDAPTLASSSREAIFAGDGGKKARSPGRARYKP